MQLERIRATLAYLVGVRPENAHVRKALQHVTDAIASLKERTASQ